MKKLSRFFRAASPFTLLILAGSLVCMGFGGVKDFHPSSPGLIQSRLSFLAPGQLEHLAASYGKLPLSFEENRGQADARSKFLARGDGYRLYLCRQEAVLALNPKTTGGKTSVVRMGLQGSQPNPTFEAAGTLPGTSNYFIGSDPSRWLTRIALHPKVRMKEVYPGIDMVYYGNQRQLEYDFVVKPGADPGAIRLSFKGIQSSKIDGQGNLVLGLSSPGAQGDLLFKTPLLYQEKNGQREEVQGRYVRLDDHRVGFQVGDYDRARTLVIDPVLDYSTYLGGSGGSSNYGSAIAADSAGNAYITGDTQTGFPVSSGAYQTTYGSGTSSIFISKLNPAGTALVYSTYLGGNTFDIGRGIAIDGGGNAYVTGQTEGNFPTTSGAYQTTYGGGTYDAILAKLSADGSTLLYSTYFGGTGSEIGQDIALDPSGNVYIIGTSTGTTPTTSGALQTTYGGATSSSNAFAAKFTLAGTGTGDLIYSTYIGSTGTTQGKRIRVNSNGNAYLYGNTTGNLQTTSGAYQTVYGGGGDAFLSELNPAGTGLVFSTYFGGPNPENATSSRDGLALDASGNIYILGTTYGGLTTTSGAFQTTFAGGTVDCYVAKFNPSGSTLLYSTYLGGSGQDYSGGIVVDSNGDAYVSGSTASSNFPTTSGAYQGASGSPGNWDVFLTELNPTGTALLYSTYLGGSTYDYGMDLAADGNGGIYISGMSGGNFPTTSGAFQTAYAGPNGGGNAIIAKFSFPTPTPSSTPTATMTLTPTNTPTPAFTATSTGTATLTPTAAALTSTPTSTPTSLPSPVASPTPTASSTATAVPFTPTATRTATSTPGKKSTPICFPNPCKGGPCHISCGGFNPSDPIRVKIYTLSGRKVYETNGTADTTGQCQATWTLNDQGGNLVSNGLYYASFLNTRDGSIHTCKVVILR